MKKDMMEILVCPGCRGKLDLKVEEEDGDEVINGGLYCGKCDERYPIDDSIPNLLSPELRT